MGCAAGGEQPLRAALAEAAAPWSELALKAGADWHAMQAETVACTAHLVAQPLRLPHAVQAARAAQLVVEGAVAAGRK